MKKRNEKNNSECLQWFLRLSITLSKHEESSGKSHAFLHFLSFQRLVWHSCILTHEFPVLHPPMFCTVHNLLHDLRLPIALCPKKLVVVNHMVSFSSFLSWEIYLIFMHYCIWNFLFSISQCFALYTIWCMRGGPWFWCFPFEELCHVEWLVLQVRSMQIMCLLSDKGSLDWNHVLTYIE